MIVIFAFPAWTCHWIKSIIIHSYKPQDISWWPDGPNKSITIKFILNLYLLESLSVFLELDRVEFKGDHLHFISLRQLEKLFPWETFSLKGGCAFSEVAEEDFLPCLYSQLGVTETQKFIIVVGHWIFSVLSHVEYFLCGQAEEEAISGFLGAFLLVGELGYSSDDGSSL